MFEQEKKYPQAVGRIIKGFQQTNPPKQPQLAVLLKVIIYIYITKHNSLSQKQQAITDLFYHSFLLSTTSRRILLPTMQQKHKNNTNPTPRHCSVGKWSSAPDHPITRGTPAALHWSNYHYWQPKERNWESTNHLQLITKRWHLPCCHHHLENLSHSPTCTSGGSQFVRPTLRILLQPWKDRPHKPITHWYQQRNQRRSHSFTSGP